MRADASLCSQQNYHELFVFFFEYMQGILSVLRYLLEVSLTPCNHNTSLILFVIHDWKVFDAKMIFGDLWKAQQFGGGIGLKLRKYLYALKVQSGDILVKK